MCVSAKLIPARVTRISASPASGSGLGSSTELRAPPGRRTLLIWMARIAAQAIGSRAMSITVVGSIAYDAVKTPFGERERMLGGAAVHFALAASFFEEVRVVGPVGEDFGESELDVMRHRGVDVSDVERIAGGKTFFWRGEYGWDLNSRETLDTQLGVFEGFQPKLSERSRASDVLFLANIQPGPAARGARAAARRALRRAGLDEPVDRHRPRSTGRRRSKAVDCLILNDAELRQLTGKPNLVSAAREILAWRGAPVPATRGSTPPATSPAQAASRGPRVIVAKQGEYGAALVTAESLLLAAGLPDGERDRPHRRRRHVRRRLRRLHRRPPRRGALRRAAARCDGARHRACLLQRRGVRHRAHRAAHRRGDRSACTGVGGDHPLQRHARCNSRR